MSHGGNFPSKQIEIRKEKENRTPTGTPKELLAWVGDDPERAERVFAQELTSPKPRKTLIDGLQGLIHESSAT